MRSSYLIFLAGFCLVFAAACTDDNGGTAGTGGAAGGGGAGGAVAECPACEAGEFDLNASIFKPYNSLLSEMTGSGDPTTDCAVPDLSGNPGADLTGITTNCLIVRPADICGCMQFEDTGGGTFNVTGEQTLSFVIDTFIEAFSAQVIVTTDSVTEFSGTGTGALPGMITLDPLTAPFNINATASGNVNCVAWNRGGEGDACTCANGSGPCADCENFDLAQECVDNECQPVDVSVTLCPLANLPGAGDNPVPLPGDPGMRTFPPITVGASSFELGAGPADPTGWYLSNPADLAGNGKQWVALAGDQQ